MKAHTRLPSWALSVTALAASVCCSQTFAQATDPQQLERVEVTGSNIKRVAKESSSPVDVITAKDIAASGAKTVLELMKMVPAIGNDGFSDSPTQNSFSRGVATVGLRNLTATSTLVLLNGRRMTPSAYANPNNGTSTLYDLNSIPLAAIERVEVLKDGASAVYGSDAIGGVINFITRNDYQGLQVKALAGLNDAGEYGKQGLSVTGGMGDLVKNGYNFFVGLDLSNKNRSMVNDKTDQDIHAADYRAINLRRNPYGSFLYNNQPWFTRESAPGNKSFPQSNAANMVTTSNCPDSAKITNTTSDVYGITTGALANRTFCNYNLEQFQEMQSPGTDISLMGHGTVLINDNMTAFGDLTYSRSKRRYLGAPRTISGTSPTSNFLLSGAAASFQPILEIGHPDNPFTNARAAVQLRFPSAPGGYDLTNDGYRAVAGVKGTIRNDIDWESAVLWNRSVRDEYYYGFLRLPVLRQMLGTAYGGTNRSLAAIAADPDLSRPVLNSGSAEIFQWDAKASTEFGQLPGGRFGAAAGVEIRRESIDLVPDPENAAGNILGLANTAVKGGRTVKSAFVELRAPVLKNLVLDAAGRVDKYPGIKTNFVPKVGFKWDALPTVGLRGTYSEGFRAPAVSQVSPGGAQFFVNGLQDPIRCNLAAVPVAPFPGAEAADCSKSVAGMGGANPALKPEKGYSSSLGIILSPMKDLDLLVGYFKIRKNGEVALGSAQDVIDHPDRYPPGSLVRDTNPALLLNGQAGTGPLLTVATPWTNQGSTMSSGIDFEVRTSKMIFDSVKYSTSLNGTYMLKYERIEQPGYASNNLVGTRGGLADWATSAGDIPRLKFRWTHTLESGNHSLMGAVNYVSGISFFREQDGSYKPPRYYSGSACQYYIKPGQVDGTLSGQSTLGVPGTATNGRDLYINRYPSCSMDRWMTFDLSYTYTGIKDLTLGLNIANFLDKKAPYDPTGGQLGYNTGLHNPYGRYFTVSAGYKFW
jgi:iron complex outermembrane receptor protein